MTKELITLANNYYLAVFAQDIRQVNSIVNKMKGLTAGGLVATNYLLSNPKYTGSVGLKGLKAGFSQMTGMLKNFSYNSDSSYDDLSSVLQTLSFYTNKGNAGTGFDPVTTVSINGYTAPSYYVSSLNNFNEQLQRLRTYPDPLNDSINRTTISDQYLAEQKNKVPGVKSKA